MVALAWGMPVALAFGLLGTLGTSLLSMTLAAVSVWFGGWVDAVIQRLTELNMILPTLPIVILVFYLYSKSIWAILGVVVVLGIFGSAIKNYRSAFLQMKEAPYIEAGQAYGAGGWRIIGRYLVPRILPVMVPQMAILVPSYVFLEATLAYLGVSDPALPTWGKVINEALTSGFVVGRAYWVLQPVALLVVTDWRSPGWALPWSGSSTPGCASDRGSGYQAGPDPIERGASLGHKSEKALQLFAGIVGAAGAVGHVQGHGTGADLALGPVATLVPGDGAAVAQDLLDGDVGRVVLLAPHGSHTLQLGAVARLGGDVGRAVAASQTAVGDQRLHHVFSLSDRDVQLEL
jgi:hypothetical protein